MVRASLSGAVCGVRRRWIPGSRVHLLGLGGDGHYPVSKRVGTTIGAPHSDPQYVFEFGLARILDGIETLVTPRSEPPR